MRGNSAGRALGNAGSSLRGRWLVIGAAALALALAGQMPAAAACDDVVFPKLTCFERLDASQVAFYFGAENSSTTACSPSVNFFEPSRFTPPTTIDPGFTPRVFKVTVDVNQDTALVWFLGNGTPLQINTQSLSDTQLCGTGNTALSACHLLTVASGASSATAACAPNERMLSGGGGCDNTLPLQPVAWQVGQIQSSAPASLTSWQVTCRIGRATANAMCCPIP